VVERWLASFVRGGILANACGTGKTVTVLLLLVLRARLAEAAHAAGTSAGPYLPTIVVVPPATVYQWVADAEKSAAGQLAVAVWYGSQRYSPDLHKAGWLLDESPEAVDEWYDKVDAKDPANLRRVLLTSYGTMTKRAARDRRPEDPPPAPGFYGKWTRYRPAPLLRGAVPEEDDDAELDRELDEMAASDEELDDDDNGEEVVDKRVYYWLLHRARFGIMVLDEAHNIKNISSRTHKSLAALPRLYTLLMTATPLMNSSRDMLGYLRFLWRDEFGFEPGQWLRNVDVSACSIYEPDFNPTEPLDVDDKPLGTTWYTVRDAAFDAAVKANKRPWILHPQAYRIAHQQLSATREADIGTLLLAPILRLIESRRLMSTQLFDGVKYVLLDSQIPPQTVRTVVLAHPAAEDSDHLAARTAALMEKLYAEGGKLGATRRDPDDWSSVRQDTSIERRLVMLTSHLEFEPLTMGKAVAQRMKQSANELNAAFCALDRRFDCPSVSGSKQADRTRNAQRKDGKNGKNGKVSAGADDVKLLMDGDALGFFYLATTREPRILCPENRISLLHYTLQRSPKFAFVAAKAYEVLRELPAADGRRRKLVVFVMQPLTHW
jgi:hypothetical protein